MSNVAVEKVEDGILVIQPICARILLVDEEESIQRTLSTRAASRKATAFIKCATEKRQWRESTPRGLI